MSCHASLCKREGKKATIWISSRALFLEGPNKSSSNPKPNKKIKIKSHPMKNKKEMKGESLVGNLVYHFLVFFLLWLNSMCSSKAELNFLRKKDLMYAKESEKGNPEWIWSSMWCRYSLYSLNYKMIKEYVCIGTDLGWRWKSKSLRSIFFDWILVSNNSMPRLDLLFRSETSNEKRKQTRAVQTMTDWLTTIRSSPPPPSPIPLLWSSVCALGGVCLPALYTFWLAYTCITFSIGILP